MSFLNGFRNVTRVCKNANSALKLQKLSTSKYVYAGNSLRPNVSNDFISASQRSFFSGSPMMNKFLTQGDQELAEFLEEEINLEKEAQVHTVLPRVKGFETEITGSEVKLTRDWDGEIITIKFNINNTVEDEAVETEGENVQDKDLKSKPKFQVDLNRKGQVLSFLCSFTEEDAAPTEEQTETEDAFEIEEFYIHDGSGDESPTQYVASAGIIDADLYNLFMNMLDDRGISRDFGHQLVDLSTGHEHKLYIKTLEDIKKFLHS